MLCDHAPRPRTGTAMVHGWLSHQHAPLADRVPPRVVPAAGQERDQPRVAFLVQNRPRLSTGASTHWWWHWRCLPWRRLLRRRRLAAGPRAGDITRAGAIAHAGAESVAGARTRLRCSPHARAPPQRRHVEPGGGPERAPPRRRREAVVAACVPPFGELLRAEHCQLVRQLRRRRLLRVARVDDVEGGEAPAAVAARRADAVAQQRVVERQERAGRRTHGVRCLGVVDPHLRLPRKLDAAAREARAHLDVARGRRDHVLVGRAIRVPVGDAVEGRRRRAVGRRRERVLKGGDDDLKGGTGRAAH
mmetsp:Transcript_6494/g.17117  ORF Transcript_6494/g.17117 Transcript_6494/m.17117 type:complete len:304 (-) Transcript_6494:7-918(-)